MQVDEKTFSEAILALRRRLGETQEGMIRLLGPDCKLRAYQRWESGESIPRAEQLIKLINLLPDQRTIADFGISIAQSEAKPKGGGLKVERKLKFPRGPGSDEVL